MDLQSFLSEELWLFILIAIVLALFLPQVWLVDYAVYFLLIVMFLTSLKIGLREVGRVVRKQRRELCISLLLVYVLSPLIAFAFSFFLEKELAVGLILYSTIPAAMANTFYMGILKKNAALALMITAVTTLLAPLIAPVIMELLTGTMVEMDSLNLFLSLVKLIILPFIAAELLRRYSRRVTGALLNKSRLISNICIFIVIYGVISAAAGQIWGLGWLALVMLAYLGLSTVLGILSPKEKFVIGFSNGFRNGTLAMVVALEVFGPTAALIGVMSTLIHNIVLVPLMFWGKNKH
jgi:bile acid:Na+ symporter, BASS family